MSIKNEYKLVLCSYLIGIKPTEYNTYWTSSYKKRQSTVIIKLVLRSQKYILAAPSGLNYFRSALLELIFFSV